MAYSEIRRNANNMINTEESMSKTVEVAFRATLASAEAKTFNISICKVPMKFSDNFSEEKIHSPDSLMMKTISLEVVDLARCKRAVLIELGPKNNQMEAIVKTEIPSLVWVWDQTHSEDLMMTTFSEATLEEACP